MCEPTIIYWERVGLLSLHKKLIRNISRIIFSKYFTQCAVSYARCRFCFQKKLITWMETKKIYPNIVAEFDDSALLKSFGQAGAGFFAGPDAITDYICRQYE